MRCAPRGAARAAGNEAEAARAHRSAEQSSEQQQQQPAVAKDPCSVWTVTHQTCRLNSKGDLGMCGRERTTRLRAAPLLTLTLQCVATSSGNSVSALAARG
jgi:hypothetical protein